MKRLALLAAVALALFSAACSGGSTTPPPPPVGNFSNSSLKGQYAFSMSGVDLNGLLITRAGSFIADGSGKITAAMEDVSTSSSVSTVQFIGGTYSILPNGRGTLTLTTATGGLGLSIALNSTTQGLMIQTDLNATSSGSFLLQTPADFSLSAINGNYVFDVSGIDLPSGGAPFSVVGQIQTNGAGGVLGGTFDENNGASPAPSGPLAIPSSSIAIQLDPSNGSTFGRGTIDFAGLSFAFYIVDNTRIKLIEEDSFGATLGDAVLQSTAIPLQTSDLKGDFVFLIGGSAVLGTRGPIARAGRFTADGLGNLPRNAIFLDDNDDGHATSVGTGTTISNATYQIDTVNAGSGRGTLTFTASANPNDGTFAFVFYLISPSQAVIQDVSNGVIGDGTMLAQTAGPFSNSMVAGDYAFNWSGVVLNSQNNFEFEEDFVGQYALSSSSSNNISGAVDFVELGSTSTHVLFTDVALTGALTISGDGMRSNAYKITTGTSPSTTFNYKAYVANSKTMFLVGIDSTRVIAGVAAQQQ